MKVKKRGAMKEPTILKGKAALNKTAARLMDLAVGSHSQWRRRLFLLQGSWKSGQLEERILQERRKILKRYGICMGIAAVLLCASLFNTSGEADEKKLFLEYDGLQQEISLRERKEQTEKASDDETLLKEARDYISGEMLGNNQSWDRISGSLVFPQQLKSGVFVRYETSDSRRISPTGQVDGIGTGKGENVTIKVTMLLRNSVSRFSLGVTVVPPRTEAEKAQALQLRAANVESGLWDMEGENGVLETSAGEEVKIVEKPLRSDRVWIAAASAAVLTALCFWGKFQEVDGKIQNRRKALADQLPLLMEQLILMMNAGLILSEALQMAAKAFPKTEKKKGEEGQLFRDIHVLCQRAAETRRPLTTLLCDYAVETGVAELIRFSTMLADHVNRGSASLVQQLKTERNYALERQWKQKESRCREMEVRLAGPLFLLLTVILILAIGPVWIEM